MALPAHTCTAAALPGAAAISLGLCVVVLNVGRNHRRWHALPLRCPTWFLVPLLPSPPIPDAPRFVFPSRLYGFTAAFAFLFQFPRSHYPAVAFSWWIMIEQTVRLFPASGWCVAVDAPQQRQRLRRHRAACVTTTALHGYYGQHVRSWRAPTRACGRTRAAPCGRYRAHCNWPMMERCRSTPSHATHTAYRRTHAL